MREATNTQNTVNQELSPKAGVYKVKEGKYRAQIRINGRKTHLGLFSTEALAVEAYQTKRKEVHGNFVPGVQ